ncbi:MAG: aminopeptidase [Candidatus Wallacebacter cryptica]|nr:aminopeptidase [Bacillota bacterium]
MRDPRIQTLAENLINYSCELQPGEKVLIECTGVETDLVTALIEAAYQAGGLPFVKLNNAEVNRSLLMQAEAEQLALAAKYDAGLMQEMDAYIGFRSDKNSSELSDVPPEKQQLYQMHYSQPVHGKIRVPHTKWVVLRYPSPAMAQMAEMSTAAFEDFYFRVCNLDYAKLSKAMDALVDLMDRTDQVRIVGPGTDLTFSIKGIPTIKCDGRLNIPDGEVFTAPVRDSVNGMLTYNTPALYQGTTFTNVRFEFENGKIVKATADSHVERLNSILDTDEGARYIGEFAIGVNPFILKPMKDTLFDEKIAGSFHFTPGSCYDEAPNGNDSSVHWDLVNIQRADFGGGEMHFDGVLIRKDGLFVLDELKDLNPDAFSEEKA